MLALCSITPERQLRIWRLAMAVIRWWLQLFSPVSSSPHGRCAQQLAVSHQLFACRLAAIQLKQVLRVSPYCSLVQTQLGDLAIPQETRVRRE